MLNTSNQNVNRIVFQPELFPDLLPHPPLSADHAKLTKVHRSSRSYPPQSAHASRRFYPPEDEIVASTTDVMAELIQAIVSARGIDPEQNPDAILEELRIGTPDYTN